MQFAPSDSSVVVVRGTFWHHFPSTQRAEEGIREIASVRSFQTE